MRFADLFKLALNNLRRNRTRSLMTFVGVLIGVAALAALLSYGAGVKYNARSEFNALEFYNTLRVTSSPNPFNALSDVAGKTRTDRNSTKDVALTDSVLNVIARMDNVLAAYPEIAFPVEIRTDRREVPATAEAIPMAFAEIPAYQPHEGAFFASSTDSSLMISPSMARRLGYERPEDIIGDSVTVKTLTLHLGRLQQAGAALALGLTALPLDAHHQRLQVVGLIEEDAQPLTGFLRVLMPLDLARNMRKITFFSTIDLLMRSGNTTGYTAARVQIRDRSAYEAVRLAVEDMGLYVAGFRDQFKQIERLFIIMDLALGIIGFIALLVATIGIANTMMMNVMERTREIGVMKAVGGDENDLKRLFLVESATLGLAGGIAGLLFGWGINSVIQIAVNVYLHRLGVPSLDIFRLTLPMALSILGVAILVSLIAGFAPARRAARIAPIEALRY